jgi:hypothetical protein
VAEGFLKLIRSDYVKWLMKNYPWAYLLLNLIALRACRSLPNNDGLQIGEAFIGDWDAIGATRGQYRHALKILYKEKIIEIIETNRTRKKATTGTTTEGTKVKILNSIIWDINQEDNNHCNSHSTTTEQPLNDHEQEVLRSKEIKEEEDKEYARTAKRPRTTNDILFFDPEKGEYVGITEKDLTDWRTIYPHIDLSVELTKSITWLKSNPSKSKKSLWRKFLTNWLNRANDTAHNKKAYAAAGAGPDRRTKDINGNPVENQHKGKF